MMDIEIKSIRRITVPLRRGTMIATFHATIGELNVHRGTLQVNEDGAFSVTTGKAGGITLPAYSQTKRRLTEAVLEAYEALP